MSEPSYHGATSRSSSVMVITLCSFVFHIIIIILFFCDIVNWDIVSIQSFTLFFGHFHGTYYKLLNIDSGLTN